MGFFSNTELKRIANVKEDISLMQSNCMQCGLYKSCDSPKMKYSGQGKKGILFIGEFSTQEESLFGKPFAGEIADFLREKLSKYKIKLNKDCWRVNALRCTPNKFPVPNPQIRCCSPYLKRTIKELKPKLIIAMGSIAINGLFGDDFSNRTIERWRNKCIPDEVLGCNVFTIYSPTQLIKEDKNKNLHCLFDRDFKRAIHCLKRPFIKRREYEKRVTILTDFLKVTSVLKKIIKEKPKIAYDYETTGLKPFRTGHKIVTIGIAVSTKKAYAFPFDYKTFWTVKELKEIHRLWGEILNDDNIFKIAHNLKFEEVWSTVKIGVRPKGHFCTMIAERILDNRSGANGLKFQTFVRFGVRPYDKEIQKFLKSKNGEFNTIEKAPFRDLLIYNGLDCIFTMMMFKKQNRLIQRNRGLLRAFVFFMNGSREMATLQLNGIPMDVKYYKKARKILEKKIKVRKKYLESGKEAQKFKKKYNRPIKITSNQDLGKLFYETLGVPAVYTNSKEENYKTDKPTLEKLKIPFVKYLLEMKKYDKALNTYFGQFERAVYIDRMYPFFDLSVPVSYRSCLVKGTKILIAKNFEKYPEGTPIEEVQEGDLIYCFDDKLNPQIQKVRKAWKVGTKEVLRVHYYRKGGHKYFDCTLDHRVRLLDGSYMEAQYLQKGNRVLAGARRGDKLNFTGHLKGNKGLWEHRLLYSKLKGNLSEEEVIHHKDGNHFNNDLSNLEKLTKSAHSRLHVYDTLLTEEGRKNSIKGVKKGWKEGKFKNSVKRGAEHASSLNLTKEYCISILHKHKGFIRHAAKKEHIDSSTFKKYVTMHNIEVKNIKILYDKHGEYISKERLVKLSKLGRAKVSHILGHNYYKLLDLYKLYNIDIKRKWANQFGEFAPGNHLITKVEKLGITQDVYDIDVPEYHNFFANEVCVHNSVSSPSFQNTPKRDKEIMTFIRKGIVPDFGCVLSEIDFSGAEVITSATLHKDPQYIHDITKGDMHRDLAMDLFMLPLKLMDKSLPKWNDDQKACIKKIRFFSKNMWTFAQFYGDWFYPCAKNLWEAVVEAGLKLPNGMPVKKWLQKQGITELGEMIDGQPTEGSFLEHCKNIESKMWNERYPLYTQWKKDIITFYQEHGYIENHFGFRFIGYMNNNQCNNFPIQSCLKGTVKVLTRDGWVPIKELEHKKFEVWTGFHWKQSTCICMGKNQMASVELSSGVVVECDINHKFKNECNKWVDFKDLALGDFVALSKPLKRMVPDCELYRYDTVKSIKVHDVHEKTYTLQVNDKLHQFVSEGGMINKNCSFHLLLHTLIKVNAFIKKNNLKTKLIGQIHDSLVASVPKDEIEIYHNGVSRIVANLKSNFDWLIIPMEVEIEISKLRENGGNFSSMEEFTMKEIKEGKHLEYI